MVTEEKKSDFLVLPYNGRSPWVSVCEELPSENEEVFVLTRSKNGSRNADKGYLTGGRWVHRGAAEVTHWMNIPKLPEE